MAASGVFVILFSVPQVLVFIMMVFIYSYEVYGTLSGFFVRGNG